MGWRSDLFTSLKAAMRNVILLAILLLACCQHSQSNKKHCVAAAQIRADRHMSTAYRQGAGRYDAELMKRKFEAECLKRLEREKNSR
jgi:hypothetical protein